MKEECMLKKKRQNVVGTIRCWFWRKKGNHTRSQWMDHKGKIREEMNLSLGTDDEEVTDLGDI